MANKGFRVVSCVKFPSLNLVQIFNITCAEPEKAHFLNHVHCCSFDSFIFGLICCSVKLAFFHGTVKSELDFLWCDANLGNVLMYQLI